MDNRPLFTSPDGEEEKHAYHTPMEQKINAALTPFQEYINSQVTASIFLFICTITALVWASVPSISSTYEHFVNMSLGFHVASFTVAKPLIFWVNDILLALFFFFVGLEIKREFLVGELTDRKKSTYVLFAATGGMLLPASIYFLINSSTPTDVAWGIPMATDTAFALGILSCFRRKIPKGAFTFLAALAIVDDIGAILVIAIFYTENISVLMLSLAFGFCVILLLINFAGFRKPLPYVFIGILICISLEAAGIHGTVSGILVAFLIPARPKKGPRYFIRKTRELIKYFEVRKEKNPLVLSDQKQHALLEEVQDIAQEATTPLQRWEGKLELPIALLVLPLFALVNAGIPLNFNLMSDIFSQPMPLGILFGLVVGKPLGVILFGQIALWLRLGETPVNTNFLLIGSVALLTGIGFTMSIFIADLSFANQTELLIIAKAAVLFGSLMAGCLGIIALAISSRKVTIT